MPLYSMQIFDDLEAVVHACELAAEWCQTFQSDVVVDIVRYCRLGEERSYNTQPKMHQVYYLLCLFFLFLLINLYGTSSHHAYILGCPTDWTFNISLANLFIHLVLQDNIL